MTLCTLGRGERRKLENLFAHKALGKEHGRAEALLWLNEGLPVPEVAALLHVSRQTVYNWAKRFHERVDSDILARLQDAPRPGRPRTAKGIIDPLIAAVLDQDPRDFGYHYTGWTAPLLRHYLQTSHGIVVSRKSVSLALMRLHIRWKRARHQLALRPATWRQAKGA
jgi:transposase